MTSGLFDNYAVGYFEWNDRKQFSVEKRYFETLEMAKDFYHNTLKHCHNKTLYRVPKDDKDIEYWEKYGGGYRSFIIEEENIAIG